MTPGRNLEQHKAVLELRKGSRTSPIDKRHLNRSASERAWKREETK